MLDMTTAQHRLLCFVRVATQALSEMIEAKKTQGLRAPRLLVRGTPRLGFVHLQSVGFSPHNPKELSFTDYGTAYFFGIEVPQVFII